MGGCTEGGGVAKIFSGGELPLPPARETYTMLNRFRVGWQDCMMLDQNAIIEAHPVITNYIFANGFSGLIHN